MPGFESDAAYRRFRRLLGPSTEMYGCCQMYSYNGCHFLHPLWILIVWNLADFRTEAHFWSSLDLLRKFSYSSIISVLYWRRLRSPTFFFFPYHNLLLLISSQFPLPLSFVFSNTGRNHLVPERPVGLCSLNVSSDASLDIFSYQFLFRG